MLCVTLQARTRSCTNITGGISDIVLFDPSDLNFTQAAAVANVEQPYTAFALRTGAELTNVFPVTFTENEAELTWKQSRNGCSRKYEFDLYFQAPENDQSLATFLQALDSAGCCCSLAAFVRYNSGKIFVVGEKYVNDASITKFIWTQDGSDGTSGKLFDDFNGGNIHLKSSYKRLPFEYTGDWADVEALIA